jgi:hypothetical protein
MDVTHPQYRSLADDEIDGVAGGFWFIVAGVALASSIPISGLLVLDAKIQEWKSRGSDGPSCPVE